MTKNHEAWMRERRLHIFKSAQSKTISISQLNFRFLELIVVLPRVQTESFNSLIESFKGFDSIQKLIQLSSSIYEQGRMNYGISNELGVGHWLAKLLILSIKSFLVYEHYRKGLCFLPFCNDHSILLNTGNSILAGLPHNIVCLECLIKGELEHLKDVKTIEPSLPNDHKLYELSSRKILRWNLNNPTKVLSLIKYHQKVSKRYRRLIQKFDFVDGKSDYDNTPFAKEEWSKMFSMLSRAYNKK